MQFGGLTESPGRNAAALGFYFNASLATVSVTRAATAQAQARDKPFVFSLALQQHALQ